MGSWDADEGQFIERARRGEAAAFEALVDKYGQMVYNLALRMLRDPQEAENLAQEAFLRAWRGLPNYREQARFSTWLYQIAANLCYSRLPGLRRDLATLLPDEGANNLPDQRQTVEEVVLSGELIKALVAAVNELPEHYRLLITLRHQQGMSYDEIARATGMPLGTVKTGIFRARGILRQVLTGEGISHG